MRKIDGWYKLRVKYPSVSRTDAVRRNPGSRFVGEALKDRTGLTSQTRIVTQYCFPAVASLLACAFLAIAPAAACRAQSDDSDSGKVAARSGWLSLTPSQRVDVDKYAEAYKAYLRVAKSASLSNGELLRQARNAGFTDFTSPSQVVPGARLIFNDHDRSSVLVIVGSEALASGSRVVAAHQDSPHINLKARPVLQAPGSVAVFKTQYYGGIKKYQWSNLPLALVGRIDTADGRHIPVNIGYAPGDPVFVIPDNAPHSDSTLRTRDYQDVLTGEELDPVAATIPGDHSSPAEQAMEILRGRFKIRDEDLVSAELELVPATLPADVGLDHGLIGSWGQDDKLSSYDAVRSLLDVQGTPKRSDIVYLTNFEEVGSVNNTGARSDFLYSTFVELLSAQSASNKSAEPIELQLRHALQNAMTLSVDTNDGINPIFPQNSEPSNAAQVGYGVALKIYGAGFDGNSEVTARLIAILDKNGIPWQTQTQRVEVGGGGTIGGFLSVHEMQVVDVGIPLLSMHAPYEMSSKVDLWNLYRFMLAFDAS